MQRVSDAGGADGDEEAAVETGIARQSRAPALLRVEHGMRPGRRRELIRLLEPIRLGLIRIGLIRIGLIIVRGHGATGRIRH